MTDTPTALDYIRDPSDIYRRSFEIVRAETDLTGMPDDMAELAIRVVHASAMPDIVADLAWTPDAAHAGAEALLRGAPVLADTRMVAEGIIQQRLPLANAVICTLYEPKARILARAQGTTRAAAAVELWGERVHGAVVAIGNAPTALFRLLELLMDGWPRPAVILGFPVGFVGAAESKQALIDAGLGIPYVTLRGRRGGSAMAAAAVNALTRPVP